VAHCCVLSVCSPFFMEQLGRELPPRGRRVVLELGGLRIGALRKLVRFLYTAELEATREEVQEVLAAARRLRVTELESLQLQGGRLVRLGPQHQLNRSCLHPPQHGSPTVAGGGAGPGVSSVPAGSSGASPQGWPCSPGMLQPSPGPGPVERVKLRKVESGERWEVVQDRQPPAAPGSVVEPRPPGDVGALGRAGRHSPPRQPPRAACRKRGQVPPAPRQGCWQAVPLGDPPGDPNGEEEEVDVGTVEPCWRTACVWPCPSSDEEEEEEEEEVDVLT